MSLFLQDDWRKSAKLTLNLGVRYELILAVHRAQRAAWSNLDVPPDFTAAVPVLSGADRAVHRARSRRPAEPRREQRRAARRRGLAHQAGHDPARRLRHQLQRRLVRDHRAPARDPAAVLDQRHRASAPRSRRCSLTNAFVERHHRRHEHLRRRQGLRARARPDVERRPLARPQSQDWNVGAGYTRTTGASLDSCARRTAGPTGLRIAGVQPFLWQTSEGRSVLNAATFRLQRRQVKGIGGSVNYTLAKSLDDASNIGGGATVVAQDDQNLEAEYGALELRSPAPGDRATCRSSCRSARTRRWLHNGGRLAAVFGSWRGSANFIVAVRHAVHAALHGAAATSRAAPTARCGPTISADRSGSPGRPSIGSSTPRPSRSRCRARSAARSRNMIIGPGQPAAERADLARRHAAAQPRASRIQATASNLLNAVNYAAIDTVVNSPHVRPGPRRSGRCGRRSSTSGSGSRTTCQCTA